MKIKARVRPEQPNRSEEIELLRQENLSLRQETAALHKKYYDTLRSYFAERLLCSDFFQEQSFRMELENLDVHFEGNAFILMQAELSEQSQMFFEDYDPNRRMQFDQACFAVENIMQELARRLVHSEVFHVRNSSYCVLCVESLGGPGSAGTSQRYVLEQLTALANEIISVVREQLGIQTTIVISRPFEGLTGIALCAQDVQSIREFRKLYHLTAPVMCYRDYESIEHDIPSRSRSFRLEKQYLSCIEHHDYEQARKLMHQLLEAEFIQTTPQPVLSRVKLISKLDLLASSVDGVGPEAQKRISAQIDQLLLRISGNDLTFSQFSAQFDALFDEILSAREEHPAAGAPSWVPQLLEYLQGHYADPELNVTQLAHVFHMSASYLTRTVRQYTGHSLFDHIQQLRLMDAIALLKSNSTLENAARTSGFGDVRTMRRAFRKYLDTTPSSFVETL